MVQAAFPHERPFLLPRGFSQVVVARQGDGGSTDNWDMNTVNETGPDAGRFLYRSHETVSHGQVTVTDLRTGVTRVLVEREDWNRMDGIVWTPWRTLLVAEEMRPLREPSLPDPDNPDALAGLVFEVNPRTGATVARPALGAKAHEGIRFDSHGNVYGISETAPGTMVGTPPQSRPGDTSSSLPLTGRAISPRDSCMRSKSCEVPPIRLAELSGWRSTEMPSGLMPMRQRRPPVRRVGRPKMWKWQRAQATTGTPARTSMSR